MKYFFLCVCVFLGALTVGQAQTATQAALERYVNDLDKYDVMMNGQIAVYQNGQTLINKGFGYANPSYQIESDGNTRYLLASVTKQFTAAAIMILVQDGKVRLDQSVADFLPDYEKAKFLTIEMLLSHTGGVPNYTDQQVFADSMHIQIDDQGIIDLIKDQPLDFAAGSEFKYSNSGYILLSIIIEKASGMSYEEFVEKRIFEPAGMTKSGLATSDRITPRMASRLTYTDDGFVPARYFDESWGAAAGSLYSTSTDMIKWHQAMMTENILSKESKAAFFKPVKENYSYGWFVATIDSVETLQHSGGIFGSATYFIHSPSEDVSVVVLANVSGPRVNEYANDLLKIVHGRDIQVEKPKATIEVEESFLKRLVGTYELMPGFELDVTTENGKLYAQATGQQRFRLFAESKTKYFLKVVKAQVEFDIDLNGDQSATQATLLQNGMTLPGKRVVKQE